jgi:N-carbamoylputrescine amidase
MEKIKVAAISTRNWIGQPEKSIKNMTKWAKKAVAEGAEFIAFPELGVNGYFLSKECWDVAEPIPGPSVERLIGVSGDLGAVLCFGILEREADIVYNTQVVVNDKGILGLQRKIHMPGTEYLYWRGGFEINVIDIGKAKIGITICYDSLFGEMVRTLYYKGAEVFVMPFAYNTIQREKFPEEDPTALTYRVHCYINGAYGIVVNNAGIRRKTKQEGSKAKFPGWAGVFDPNGKVVAFTRQPGRGEAMALAELDPEKIAARRRNPYFVPRCLRPEIYTTIGGHSWSLAGGDR